MTKVLHRYKAWVVEIPFIHEKDAHNVLEQTGFAGQVVYRMYGERERSQENHAV